jgi:hypothetical protein
MVVEVLLREGPLAFGLQNASLQHMLWLAATHNLEPFSDTAAPCTCLSWNRALGCSLGLLTTLISFTTAHT